MTNQINLDELEKEITFMQQELLLKRNLLTECREKLNKEISEHIQTKLLVTKQSNEIKELQVQLDISLKAAQKLEAENSKNREIVVRLQVHQDAYSNEKELLIKKFQDINMENSSLKSENSDLKEKLKGYISFENKYKERQLETSRIINEILRKQEILNKEQTRLETVCKEGLQFAATVSEEAKHQAKFVQEAKLSQKKMEDEIIRLVTALKQEKDKNEVESMKNDSQNENINYLEEWKLYKQEMNERTTQLLEENRKLTEELNFATSQIDLLMKNY